MSAFKDLTTSKLKKSFAIDPKEGIQFQNLLGIHLPLESQQTMVLTS